MIIKSDQPFLVIDVESVGLYGPAFAVAGVLLQSGKILHEFCFAFDPELELDGLGLYSKDDLKWVKENVKVNFDKITQEEFRDMFWVEYMSLKLRYPELILAADCNFPVETNFLAECVRDNLRERKWQGSYPFLDIATMLYAVGSDPIGIFDRQENEKPAHNPLCDARQSARMLATAINLCL